MVYFYKPVLLLARIRFGHIFWEKKVTGFNKNKIYFFFLVWESRDSQNLFGSIRLLYFSCIMFSVWFIFSRSPHCSLCYILISRKNGGKEGGIASFCLQKFQSYVYVLFDLRLATTLNYKGFWEYCFVLF